MNTETKTDRGFKISVNRRLPVKNGYNRAFSKCNKCGNRVYYDYVPYSLSNPIITTPCGHDFKYHYKSF